MTLRTRTSHPYGATGGAGRPRLSDGRLRHRRGRPHPHHPEPAAVRRRAEALLGGSHPPPAPPPEAAADQGPAIRSVADRPPEGIPPSGGTPLSEVTRLSGGAALRLAVRERLPVWLQARCALEPRTVAAVAVVLVAAVGVGAQQYWAARPQPVAAPSVVAPAAAPAAAPAPVPSPGPPAAGGGAVPRIVVDVSGKVRDPGVRRLPAGSRVEDALAAAGGVRPGTDTTGLNRARVLVDGEQVVVGAPVQPAPAGPGAGAGGGAGGSPGPLSLGTATVEQLDGLPGVGPVLAQHIVEFRTARGGFRSVEELRQVDGIGERRFADLRKLVRP
ncbi:ComEA family DNA-binding protein [Streptomyces sp. NPDC097981]|uniref:ComEA family DNA-binding protein n=1 Tax=Streptomyces sp. NPDC097981 TaxID=3155428 RepID=UPI003334A0A1